MCGIIGGVGDGVKNYIQSNLYMLKNRGPDSNGSVTFENGLTLGATRLAMTDPHPRSNQPMLDGQTGCALVFNGELYNFRKLKKELANKNVKFFTESDTEVLLKAIAFYGVEYVSKIEGMFSFGFYDPKKNTLVLARDFLGKKPLYYSKGKNFFIFSSQVDVIKKFLMQVNIDNVTLTTYLKLGYILDPRTMYKEINAVQPGEVIVLDLSHVKIMHQKVHLPDAFLRPQKETISNLVRSSINERVTGHNKFAISMSGGIDSTIIAIESVNLGLNFEAYTMNWKDSDKPRYNQDSEAAKLICKKLGIKFNSVEMPPLNTLDDQLSKYINAIGEPNSNPSGISMMSLYDQISKDKIRLVLTGDGSDEIFGGYERYKILDRFSRVPSIPSNIISDIILFNSSKFKISSKLAAIMSAPSNSSSWYFWHQLADNLYLKKFYEDFCFKNYDLFNNDANLQILGKNFRVERLMQMDFKVWLAMESNSKLDRISMNYSIEARCPFQSEKLISKAKSELSNFEFHKLEKKILIDQYPELKFLPTNRSKLGFMSPLGHWLRGNNGLVLDSLKYLESNFNFNQNELLRLSKSAIRKNYSEFRFVWNLIVLARWSQLDKL